MRTPIKASVTGIAIMTIVGSLYVMNVGLDEVFNPRLRST